ncbi:MAG: Fic family protein [Elusimicrobiota bacterium]
MYKPIFEITPELLRLISEATELKTWIHESLINVPWLPQLQKETIIRLTHSSTSIEGNPLSLDEVEMLLDGKKTSGSDKDKLEVTNQYKALKWVSKKKARKIITEKSLLTLHKIITNKLLSDKASGHYKQRSNRVINPKGHTVYSPPPPEKAEALTQNLIEWINSDEAKKLHPIMLSAIAHFQLVSIHPFSDGNGRISRALGIWLLYARDFDIDHVCALDDYFKNEHQLYYDKLTQTRELDDDLTYWLKYVAKGVVHTLKQTKERILSLQISHKGSKIILTKRQEEVLRLLRDKGRLKAPDIEKAFDLTRARVAQIMKPLTDAGFVIRE